MPLSVQAYGHSDVGRKRKVNEDSFAVDEARGIYIVADGMGGHGNGATASQTAASVAREHLNANIVKLERYRDDPSEQNRAAATAAVEQAIQAACERVFRIGQQDSAKRGMGTTMDVIVRAGDRAILGHVGDGRVYLVRGGQGYRLTKDHTIVAQQVEAGIITAADAEQSTLRGVLTRAVGTHASVQVDTLVVDLAGGDILMMCSDGVHRYLRDDEVGARLRDASAATARQIIDWANTSGGEDNSSVILIGCRPPEVTAAAPAPEQNKITSRIDAVRGLPLFQHLSYKEQVAILSIAHSRIFEPGAEIVKQGDPGQEMFIIVDGEVSVVRDGVTIAELGPGGHFGEMSIVDDAPRSASVRAKKRTDVLTIGQAEIGGLMRLDPVLAVKILWTLVQALSGRLRVASAELIEFKLETPRRESSVQLPFAR